MNLDKTKVRRSFAAASSTYDNAAALQRTVGRKLLRAIASENPHGTLVDLGCGTGFLTGELLRLAATARPLRVIALDIALPMLQRTRGKLENPDTVRYLCADAESLPLAERSIDGLFSNLALQWCGNPDAVFTGIQRALKPDSPLIFSIFGPKTLWELKGAWAEADDYSHVNEFHSEEQLRRFLRRAGFGEIRTESALHVSRYDSVFELMHELKQLGAHNVMTGRNKHLTTKTNLQRMIAAYERHGTAGRIPATFEIILVSAKAVGSERRVMGG
jgi:malonyl-CoA O-methyltransferase